MDFEKLTLCAFADEANDSLDGQIKALRRNGFNALEIRGVDGKNIADLTVEQCREIRKKLDDNGLFTWSIGSPSGKIKLCDDFIPHLDSFKNMLDLASVLGATRFRMFSFYGTEDKDAAFTEVCERLYKFVDAAKGYDIVLCHENEKDIYGDKIEGCIRILEAFPQIKAVFDPANFIQCGVDTLEAWEKIKPYIDYIHIKDARFSDGNVVPAGKGDGHIKEILTDYVSTGGRVITLEPHLSEFTGLSALEGDSKSVVGLSEFHFDTRDNAFDFGAEALKNIIKEI